MHSSSQSGRLSSLNGTMNSNASSAHSTKKISPAELAKLNERIAKPRDYSKSEKLPPLHEPRVIPKEQLDTSIERMYKSAMEIRTKNHTSAIQRRDAAEAPKKVVISHEDLEDSVQRLYTQSVDRMNRSHEALANKYLFKAPPMPQVIEAARVTKGGRSSPNRSRTASPDTTAVSADGGGSPTRKQIVDRLYTRELEGIAKRKDAIYQRYVASTEPKVHKADSGEISEIVERLYAGKK